MTDQPTAPVPADLALETTAFWVEVADILGFPRSVGEIYGLLFVTETPLNADDIVEKLGVSRSGVGQALKTLTDIGAIRTSLRTQSSRKDHYELQTDLGILVRLFLNSRVLPRLDELSRRRTSLAAQTNSGSPTYLVQRFEKLDRWRGKTAPLLALLKTLAS